MKFLLPLLFLGVALPKLQPRSYRRSSRIPKLLNFKLKIRDIYSFTGGLKNDRRIRPKIKTLITRKELRELHRRLKAGKYSSHHIRRLKFPFDRTNIFHRALPKAAFLKNTIRKSCKIHRFLCSETRKCRKIRGFGPRQKHRERHSSRVVHMFEKYDSKIS